MKPFGPLMIEHRLIERMVGVLGAHIASIEKGAPVDTLLIEHGVDVFRTYADRTHHGKEEDILFARLEQKKLSAEHRDTMNRLIEEHKFARSKVKSLLEANEKYREGDQGQTSAIISLLKELTEFYPRHIELEDDHFFRPVMHYFDQQEQDRMLEDFFEFDRKMIHEKYAQLIEEFEE